MTETYFIEFPNRGLITVAGTERREFLQGLISNDIDRTNGGDAIWAAVLTPQGKYRHDFFLFDEGERFIIECEGGERLMDLGKTLRQFVLREDVTLGIDTTRKVYAVFGKDALQRLNLPARAGASSLGIFENAAGDAAEGIAFVDPRDPVIGARLIADPEAVAAFFKSAGISEGTAEDWDRTRILRGIPDGSRDMQIDKALLIESGFDELGGVDWKKGCFMGQELTARTKYRGLAKKRLLPVTLDGPAPETGTAIDYDGKSVGETRSAVDGAAMALIQLDALGKSRQSGMPFMIQGNPATATIPEWMQLPETA